MNKLLFCIESSGIFVVFMGILKILIAPASVGNVSMTTRNVNEANPLVRTADLIGFALNDYAEYPLPLNYGMEPWCDSVGAAYAGRSLQEMYVELMVRCSKLIAQCEQPALLFHEVKKGTKFFASVDVLRPGVMLVKAAQAINVYRQDLSGRLETMHPLVALLMQMVDEKIITPGQKISECTSTNPSLLDKCLDLLFLHRAVAFREIVNSPAGMGEEKQIEHINSIVVAFRDKVRRQHTQIRQWERSTVLRRQRVSRELLSLVENGMTRLYVVRMNLWLCSGDPSTAQDRSRVFFLRFLNNLRFKPKISRRLHRVIWRLLVGTDAVNRYHCLFIMEGSLVGAGAKFAELIGMYWQVEITAGQGKWFDWAYHPSASCRATVGGIDLSDKQKMVVFMDWVLSYVADFNLYVRPPNLVLPKTGGVSKRAELRLFGSRCFSST